MTHICTLRVTCFILKLNGSLAWVTSDSIQIAFILYEHTFQCEYTFTGPAGFRCGVTREERPVAATAESYWALQGEQESVTTGLYFQERSISPSPCPDSWLLDDGRSLRSRTPSNPTGQGVWRTYDEYVMIESVSLRTSSLLNFSWALRK